jgi:hypothetical protein
MPSFGFWEARIWNFESVWENCPLLLGLDVESEVARLGAIFRFGGLRRRGDSSRESTLGGSEGARECSFVKE